MSRPSGGSCNGGYNQKKDYGRPYTLKGTNPRTPKPGKQPNRVMKKRAQDGTRANAKR